MNIQKNTVVDRIFRNREYRPPWLWSLVEMIERTHDEIANSDCRTIVHPTAGGRIRGAHNCKKCDAEVVAAIERYSVSRDLREFKGLDCDCKNVWRTEISNDFSLPVPLGQGRDRRLSRVDMVRAP